LTSKIPSGTSPNAALKLVMIGPFVLSFSSASCPLAISLNGYGNASAIGSFARFDAVNDSGPENFGVRSPRNEPPADLP
jgi:hypothetical protein